VIVESTQKKTATKKCKIVQKIVFVESIATVSELGVIIFSFYEFVDEVKRRYCCKQKECRKRSRC